MTCPDTSLEQQINTENTQHYRLCYFKNIYVFVCVLFIGIKTYKSKYLVKLCILQELINNVLKINQDNNELVGWTALRISKCMFLLTSFIQHK